MAFHWHTENARDSLWGYIDGSGSFECLYTDIRALTVVFAHVFVAEKGSLPWLYDRMGRAAVPRCGAALVRQTFYPVKRLHSVGWGIDSVEVNLSRIGISLQEADRFWVGQRFSLQIRGLFQHMEQGVG